MNRRTFLQKSAAALGAATLPCATPAGAGQFTGRASAEVRGGDWPYLTDVAQRMNRVLDL